MSRPCCLALVLMLADLPTPDPPPGAAREKADQILSDSQFQSSSKSVPDRVVDWLVDQIKIPFSDASGGNSVVGFVILIACLVGLGYVVSRMRFGLPVSVASDDGPIDIDIDEDRPADVWRADAEQAEAAGEWKLALRARYRWLLGVLLDRQLLVNVPGRTPGEYRNDMGRILPDEATAFATATDLFERAWYGNEPTGPDENHLFRSCAEQVIAAAERASV